MGVKVGEGGMGVKVGEEGVVKSTVVNVFVSIIILVGVVKLFFNVGVGVIVKTIATVFVEGGT